MAHIEELIISESETYEEHPRFFIVNMTMGMIVKVLLFTMGGWMIYIGKGEWLVRMPDDDDETPTEH